MLPYSLKLVWFSLSLSGLISCWAVLSAFALAIRSYWLALLYCIGCTILQGMFCLGLIWRMDPFLMPRSFCIAQTLLSGFASFLLTGVCATFSMITSLAISSSGAWNMTSAKMYAWHPNYTLTLIIFPLLASVAQITTVLRLNAAQPTDGFACDANRPECIFDTIFLFWADGDYPNVSLPTTHHWALPQFHRACQFKKFHLVTTQANSP
ncbi:hypothetical protein F5890DRAFT_1090673 [Lentinula detonsa]|uniref:Uncharacterized protein n=1 Tax=Lentinula detonsa TaxID=2804962 RepID=A0AA38Q1N5_9AGAR|nr:hypothetical protein F5890DRAFT_1090673 [Lentinula detonsa]